MGPFITAANGFEGAGFVPVERLEKVEVRDRLGVRGRFGVRDRLGVMRLSDRGNVLRVCDRVSISMNVGVRVRVKVQVVYICRIHCNFAK